MKATDVGFVFYHPVPGVGGIWISERRRPHWQDGPDLTADEIETHLRPLAQYPSIVAMVPELKTRSDPCDSKFTQAGED